MNNTPYGGNPSGLVDKRFGNSYQVIKEVHASLAQILFLADNMNLLSPREIELQESPDLMFLQWRREGDPTWKNLVSLADLAANIAFPPDAIPQVPSNWAATDGVTQILNKPTIPAAQIHADWNATTGLGVIDNKPTIPAAQVESDWDATTGPAFIKNKPTLGTSGIADAPQNNKTYAREQGAWVEAVAKALIGAVNGVASLGADGKVPAAQLPVPSSTGGGGFTPIRIAAGTTYVVPVDNQAVFTMPMVVDGTLQIDGYLVEV